MILDLALSLLYGCVAYPLHIRRSPHAARAARLALALWPALLVWIDLPRSEGSGLRALLLTAILTASSYAQIRRIRTTPPGSATTPGFAAFMLDLTSIWLIMLPASLLILVGFPFGPSILDISGIFLAASAAFLLLVGDAQLETAHRLGLQTWYEHGIRRHVREPALVAQACLILSIYLLASAGGVGLISLLGPLAGLIFLRRQARLLAARRQTKRGAPIPLRFFDYFPSLQAAIGLAEVPGPLDESSSPIETPPLRLARPLQAAHTQAESRISGDHAPVGAVAPPAEGWWTPPKSPPKS
jgi:hypothetical protein